ncbi:MAG TPA: hypothetical protein VN643_03750 [Pyrinomonadaceae bacterium]|nr:hypothetical protein [Pyrinomonadaceae bacterium]
MCGEATETFSLKFAFRLMSLRVTLLVEVVLSGQYGEQFVTPEDKLNMIQPTEGARRGFEYFPGVWSDLSYARADTITSRLCRYSLVFRQQDLLFAERLEGAGAFLIIVAQLLNPQKKI